ncbi:MAG: outer membrane lipoprotein SlyB [Lentimonas sp.]|jgi:outer membrane lipoprotein SlyB
MSALLLSGCTSGTGPSARDLGMLGGAILGGIAGNQVGSGGQGNVIVGAVLGGVLGNLAGSEVDQRKEALEAAEAQRQYEYEQEVQQQQDLEQSIKKLEAERVRDEIARKATKEDVLLAELEAARIEGILAEKRKAYEASQERARRIQEAQERLAKAQQELAELELKNTAAE